jgi:hypothetical protein
LLNDRTMNEEQAEREVQEEQQAAYALRERQEQRQQEKAKQAEKLQAMRDARELYERAQLAERAEKVIARREDAKAAITSERRAMSAAVRAEKAVQVALERRRRQKALDRARVDAEDKEEQAMERSERVEEARARTMVNLQSTRDSEQRAERLADCKQEAEWQVQFEKSRKEGAARRLQGTKAIDWGGGEEAEAQHKREVDRAERTARARKQTEAHIARARYDEMRKWQEGDWEEHRERLRCEEEMRQRHARNRVEGDETMKLALVEKEKIDAQNARYRKARAAIKSAKEKSAQALQDKLANDAKEEAARVTEEKRLRREQFHLRETARTETMKRAQNATEKELQRVARQQVRRDINREPVPRSEAEWLGILTRLAQPTKQGSGTRIDSDELLTFLNGPKHRDFVKWYLKRERGCNAKTTLPRWLAHSTVSEAAQQFCLEFGLPKVPPDDEESAYLRARNQATDRTPWCPPSGRGQPPKVL